MQTPLKPLSDDYYLANFHELLRGVELQYASLLPPAIRQFLACLAGLPQPAQALLVRLLLRRGDCFRQSKLNYVEIGPVALPLKQLAEVGFVALNPELTVASLLPLFNKAEWLAKWRAGFLAEGPERGIADQCTRARLDTWLAPQLADLTAAEQARVAGEPIVQLLVRPLFEWLKLLYFGNAHQDLSEFVLRELALSRYETYPLTGATRLFQSWDQVEQQMRVEQLLAEWQACTEPSAEGIASLLARLPTVAASDTRLRRRVARLKLALARALERLPALPEALALYRQVDAHPARERAARILVQQGLPEQALGLCREILTAPLGDDEREFAEGFGHRTARKLSCGYWPKPALYSEPVVTLTLPKCEGPWGDRLPEWAVASHFAASGPCFYVENSLVLAVFALAYWPVIFAPVVGAFSHPFQSKPHDLFWPTFLDARRAQKREVDHWLAQQAATDGKLPVEELLARYRTKLGVNHALIHWGQLPESLLVLALERIPAGDWLAIFDYLWQDLESRRRGLPDLIHFPKAGGYQWLEVKGPGDKLQPHQRRWLQFFASRRIDHQVVKVVWQA
ncbi:VRR-NUC domain-containing protein [Halioxenophilus sp. WMMB6]|uniref:VRR-NUC domain-containing protein n=1 Tax=Halioxenophilus sp. WMMB6 TaxID=3073815 RepID=UPI00295E9B9B|nr:VRR-NUC domain-containing protein [Halioxenophilus sp. WMMB6]